MRYTKSIRIQTPTYAFLMLVALVALVPFLAQADNLHKEITNAIIGLASEDKSVKEASIKFLLAAPPEFRENIERQYRQEAATLAQSLPQQIDADTTAASIFVSQDETQINYTVSYSSEQLTSSERQALGNYLADLTRNQVCHTGGTVLLSLLYGKQLVRNCFYDDGKLFHTVRISWRDCE